MISIVFRGNKGRRRTEGEETLLLAPLGRKVKVLKLLGRLCSQNSERVLFEQTSPDHALTRAEEISCRFRRFGANQNWDCTNLRDVSDLCQQ